MADIAAANAAYFNSDYETAFVEFKAAAPFRRV